MWWPARDAMLVFVLLAVLALVLTVTGVVRRSKAAIA
jgi:hypothetical protein